MAWAATISCSGGADGDELLGGGGRDILSGGSGSDLLLGEDGNDFLSGGTGNDRLEGGAGSDTYLLGPGSGFDTISDTAGVSNIRFAPGVNPSKVQVSKTRRLGSSGAFEYTDKGSDLWLQYSPSDARVYRKWARCCPICCWNFRVENSSVMGN